MTRSERERASQLDLILQAMVNSDQEEVWMVEKINLQLLPHAERGYCLSLLYTIIQHPEQIVELIKTTCGEGFSATPQARKFLQQGGYMKMQEQIAVASAAQMDSIIYASNNARPSSRRKYWLYAIAIITLLILSWMFWFR